MSGSMAEFSSAGPTMDRELGLPSGRTVRVRNRSVFSGNGGKRLQLMMQVEPAYDPAIVPDQATELANLFDDFASQHGIDGIQVTVCASPNCLAFKERPLLLYTFRRGSGRWVLQPTAI